MHRRLVPLRGSVQLRAIEEGASTTRWRARRPLEPPRRASQGAEPRPRFLVKRWPRRQRGRNSRQTSARSAPNTIGSRPVTRTQLRRRRSSREAARGPRCAPRGPVAEAITYERRRPDTTPLYAVVQDNLETLNGAV